MIRMDGKEVSLFVREQIKKETESLKNEYNLTPGLAVIIVGNDPASTVYVRNKHKACEEVGFNSIVIEMPEDTTEEKLLSKIKELNDNKDIHGILVQLPLPKHIDENHVILAINPEKDVDAFHPYNVGRILTGKYSFVPCTPAGVMEILDYYHIDIASKNCVVIGRSNIVGKPQALLLLEKNGTVTICHSKTNNLKEITSKADILVAAVGKPLFVTEDMVKDGAVVVDVGINRNAEGKLVGDVDFENVAPKCYAITPVPGGVGPMTITMLLKNTLSAAKTKISLDK